MIKFGALHIEGFGSILGPFSYRLDRTGINLILAKNGAGKSTIFNALYWALYGDVLKDIKSIEPYEWIQNKDYKGTKVSVVFDNYTIIRCKDYKGDLLGSAGKNRLVLIADGKPQTQYRDKTDVQKAINEILGCSSRLFRHYVMFGQKLTRLMGESGTEQTKILDEAFEVAYLNRAKDEAARAYNDFKAQKDKAEHSYEVITLKAEKLQEQLSNINSLKKDIKARIKENKEKIAEQKAILKKQPKNIISSDELYKLQKEISDVGNSLFRTRLESTSLEGKLKDLESFKKALAKKAMNLTTCSECGNKLKPEQIKNSVEDLKKQRSQAESDILVVKDKIKKNKSYIDKNEIKLEGLQKELKKLRDLGDDSEFQKANARLKIFTDEAIKLKTRYSNVPDSSELSSQHSELLQQREQLEEQIAKLDKRLKNYEWLLKDPLSNKGLKAYIFDNMLQVVNKQAIKYSKTLGYSIKLYKNLDSGHKSLEASIYEDDKELNYKALSGGQQQLVDITAAFALHDAISLNSPMNILCLDEVFESLDVDNIEKVRELIKVKGAELSIHLTTHRSEFSNNNHKVTELYLEAPGVTTIKR